MPDSEPRNASRISIIIPCHNAESYLAQTLGSTLDQSRPPHEILVVDDGSTDDSRAIARRFETCFPQTVRLFSESSGNAARTRNLGAIAATGDALMFLDADDVLAPTTLEALEGALAGQPGTMAICPWYRLELDGQRWIARPPSCAARPRGYDALAGWLTGWYHPPCSMLWSREAFERAGRWDEEGVVNQDGDLVMRALAAGIPLRETHEGAGYYRRLPSGQESLSGRRLTREGLAARIRTVEKIACWLPPDRLADYRQPIREAFLLVAADAEGHHPDLREKAWDRARRYAPWFPARARVEYRSRPPQRAGPAPVGAGVVGVGGEVRFGADRAQKAIPAGPTSTAPTAALPSTRVKRPAVSVLIPTYNRAHLLPRTLQSVLAQTFDDFEVLIIDDASTDQTPSVVARHAEDPRVRYLRQKVNRGVGAARNRGLREARGELIAFLDSDDEWFPQKLATQVHRLRGLPRDVGLVYCGVENAFGDGRRTFSTPTRRGDLFRNLLLTNVLHGGGSSVLMRRSVVATVGFFDEAFPAIEDFDYWLRIARFFKIDCHEEPLIRYHNSHELKRKSLNFEENIDARARFFAKHASEMKSARVAHLFLLKSARRHLDHPGGDASAARRLAARAIWHAPMSRQAYRVLLRSFFPSVNS